MKPPVFSSETHLSSFSTAPVSGFARSFISGKPLANAKITILENGHTLTTDALGNFGPIEWPVGKTITLVLEKKGYRTTQSATLVVPEEGLTGLYNQISFQVPSHWIFKFFSYAMGIAEDPNACQIGATITDYNKTLDDLPQGIENAKAILFPEVKIKPFYFSIFKSWPLKYKTSPFNRRLTSTSLDGGIIYANIPPSDTPYTLSAVKEGVTFNEVKFIARRGMFINLSPPHGPMAHRR